MGTVSTCHLVSIAVFSILGNPFVTLSVLLVKLFGCCGFSENVQMKVLKLLMGFFLIFWCFYYVIILIFMIDVTDTYLCETTGGGSNALGCVNEEFCAEQAMMFAGGYVYSSGPNYGQPVTCETYNGALNGGLSPDPFNGLSGCECYEYDCGLCGEPASCVDDLMRLRAGMAMSGYDTGSLTCTNFEEPPFLIDGCRGFQSMTTMPGYPHQDVCCETCSSEYENAQAMCGTNGVKYLFYTGFIVRIHTCMSSTFCTIFCWKWADPDCFSQQYLLLDFFVMQFVGTYVECAVGLFSFIHGELDLEL